ncbi:MAG: hypothetical protein JRH08_11575 [Deltaproteobacteria bacterium]|nr:hypothetical protein [Deltaproteobacteria bacterium]
MAKFKPKPRNCKNCGKVFPAMRFWAKFCSPACRIAYWRKTHPQLSPEERKKLAEDIKKIKERLMIDD